MGAAVLKILCITNRDERFYQLLGPFLSRREIVAELGAPVWDDDGKEWFIAMRGRKVVGFAALRTVGKSLALCSDYVLPDERCAGVYTELLRARLEAAGEKPLKVVATAPAVAALKAAGLKKSSARGKYTVMERT